MEISKILANQKRTALLFLDMEFLGFENPINDAWEIGWILEFERKEIARNSFYLGHSGKPSTWVLKNTLYSSIFLENKASVHSWAHVFEVLNQNISMIEEGVDVHVIGAAVEGDFRYLKEKAIAARVELLMHWRSIDLSNAFMGYMWAKGYSLNVPTNVPKMMKVLGIPSVGTRHTVDTDNEDLRKIYYALFPAGQ